MVCVTFATRDVDVVYQRSPENIARLVAALTPSHPYLRGAPRAAVPLGRGLTRLIAVKRAAGRPKDLEAVAELEAIEEERQRGNS